MITLIFYLILSCVFVSMYGPLWLKILLIIVVTFDIVMIPFAWKKGMKVGFDNAENKRKAELYDKLKG